MIPLQQQALSVLAGFLLAYLLLLRRPEKTERLTSGGSVRDDMYRTGFDQAPVGIAYFGAAGQWLQANRRFAISLGYALDDLLKTPGFHTIIHPEERKNHVAQTKRLLGGDIPVFSTIRRIQMKDGRYVSFRVWMSASRRKPEFVECILGEIDSATPSEASPAVAAAVVPDLLEQLEDVAVVRSNPSGVITSWSRGAERLFGYKSEQTIGKARSFLYRDADVWSEKPTAHLRTSIASRRLDIEDERVGKDGFVFTTRVTILPEVEGETLKGFAEVFRLPVKAALESEELRKERDKSRQEIEKLSGESEKLRASAQRADQLGPANEDLRKENEALRLDLRKKEGVEESLRDAIQQLRVTDEELMNELKVLTDALRKEIDRRRGAEYELQEAESELARTSTEWQARLEALVQTRAGDERERAGEEDISAALSPDRPWKEFDAIGPIELLIEMSQGERSGTLFIVSGKIEKKIHFAFGKIYSCASNVPSLFLAEILIADGTITQEQRNRAVDISRESGIALGRILVIMGAVTEAQLVESMHRKIEKEVAGVLAFSEGRSLFVEGEMPLVQMIPLRVEVIPLIEALLARPPVLEYVQPETLVEGPSEVLEDESIDSTAEANAIKEGEQPESAVPSYEDLDEGPAPAELHASEARTDSSDSAAAADPATDLAIEEVPNDAVVGSKSGKSKKYHRPGCKNASRIAPASRVSFDSPAAAESAGFDRCKICFGK